MDSPSFLGPETPVETDDAIYPCKGCGDVLEEGKAFELAGNRWHIDCFRCNTCRTLLDSDANLLLLGDGSLICNNCTYSCSACGNKIEDLAILTGDQAFCASCFKCRNCKRKIDNLRYARTSQGIFCMQCHESLMSRRRKRSKQGSRAASANSSNSGAVVLDKSLPALPPSAISQSVLHEGVESPGTTPNSETPTERSPLPHPMHMKDGDPFKHVSKREISPSTFDQFRDSLSLEALANERGSGHTSPDSASRNDRDGFIPMTLDPSPRTRPVPLSRNRTGERSPNDHTLPGTEQVFKDDFRDLVAGSSHSRSASKDRSRMSPQLGRQESARQNSRDPTHGIRHRNQSMNQSPSVDSASPAMGGFERVRKAPPPPPPPPAPAPPESEASEGTFKLQEAPKVRRKSSASRHASKGSVVSTSPAMALAGQTEGTPLAEQGATAPSSAKTVVDQVPELPKRTASNRRSNVNTSIAERPTRQDSLRKAATKQNIPRKELPRSENDALNVASRPSVEESSSSTFGSTARLGSSVLSNQPTPATDSDSIALPPRSSSRPGPASDLAPTAERSGEREDFTAPREAPMPPYMRHKPNESVSSIQSEHFEGSSPHAAHEQAPTFLSSEEDDRYNKDEDVEHPGIFRKVSKAVRHGRSHSDKVGSPSAKWHKPSRNESIDISSPMLNTADGQEDPVHLRNKLRFSQQRIAELETEKSTLQEQANSTTDMRQVNAELRTKRDTMAFLDTQREMVVRELETMTDQLAKAKESEGPIDFESLQSEALAHFTQQLHQLRSSLGDQIEDLMRKKNDLTNEIANLIQMKDKGFQEYESLSTKNQNLMDHNNQLLQSIQNLYKQGRQGTAPSQAMPPPSGLGIYTTNLKDKPEGHQGTLSIDTSHSHLSGETEVEPATVLTAPQVVNIRKGQPKKFSWKKGGENLTKNVKRGFKGAFATDRPSALKEEHFAEGAPYNSMPAGEAPQIGDRPIGQRNASDNSRPGPLQREVSNHSGQNWGGLVSQKSGSFGKPSKSASGLPADSTLFGADLTARCEYERRLIPSIVTRCIEEVESRGMEIEGIYRKSGSFTQVKQVQQGFEDDVATCDISDADMDIHSVTSALKQYLRKLPVPLISFEPYDDMLDAVQHADEASRIEGLHRALSRLPPRHKDTLEFLIMHLVRVMAMQGDNFMGSTNLAVVFAPTIMRPASLEREMADMEAQRHVIEALLLHSRDVFRSGSGEA